MKKLFFLLFLLPFMAVAQVSTGQEQDFDYGIKNNSSQQILTPDTLVTKGVDGTYGHTSAYRLPISNDTYDSLQTKVPYTGATSNVDLSEFGLKTGNLKLDLTPTSIPTEVGTIYWDTINKTASLIDGLGNTALQIGQEERTLIHNSTGSTLTDGQVVYVTGSTGALPSVALASATIESTSAATLGVVTESIPNGSSGFVSTIGIVNGLNTLAFNEGDILWLSNTSGEFTNVKPTSPSHLVLIGYVIKKAGGNGSILVKIQNTQELAESSDVLFGTLANNDLLVYESSTGLWKNKTAASVGLVSGTGTTNTLPKFTGASTLGNSNLSDNGTIVTSITDMLVNNITVGKGGGNINDNTSVGNLVLSSNTTGLANTGIGYQTLQFNTTGNYNTGIGNRALRFNTTGANNTAVGLQSLNSNTSGVFNTSFGYISLFGNQTGSNNISIGALSGGYISDKVTSATILNNSVLLGYRTSPLADNQTNQIVIGYDATGLGSNSTVIGNSSTTFGRWYGRLLLGTNTDNGSDQLQVNGSASFSSTVTASNGTLLGGTGTTNTLPKFTGASTLGNSNLSDNGTIVTSTTDMSINGLKVGKGVASFGTILGDSAGANTTSGNNYVIIGSSSANANISGNNFTSIGRQAALYSTTSGGYVALGYRAGTNTSTGANATSIGNSIFIGVDSRPLGDTQSNQIVIGADSRGLGSNSTVIGNSSTTKTGIYGRLQLSNNATLPTDDGVSALNINGGVKLNTSPTTSAGSYEILTRNTSTGVVEKVASSAVSEPYLVYTALISQSGTSAPTAIVLRNTTGATVTYGYTGVGTYTATFSSGVLTSNKTTTYLGNAATDGIMSSYVSSTTVANINTVGVNGGYAFKNSYLSSTLFEIRVYP